VETQHWFRRQQRRACLAIILFGGVLLATGTTGCGNEPTVTAAAYGPTEPSYPHSHDPATEPAAHAAEHADDHEAEASHEMPAPACSMSRTTGHGGPTAEERRLYLTPGGRYKAADIDANGPLLPSQRFRRIESRHDMHPQPGDRLCPVTGTRASPNFTWIVGGKAYQFCCPPCVDEFVRQAKEHPRTLRPPDHYVKR
jgi:hypothetical protein